MRYNKQQLHSIVMALISCKECNGSVSTEAAACPHCGAPQQRPVPPVQPKEETIYSDNAVAVTNTRVIILGTTYTLRNITSVRMNTRRHEFWEQSASDLRSNYSTYRGLVNSHQCPRTDRRLSHRGRNGCRGNSYDGHCENFVSCQFFKRGRRSPCAHIQKRSLH